MPNWCENKLRITGKNGVLGCLEAIKGEPDEGGPCHIDFQRIVPMPAILESTVAGDPADLGRVLLGDDGLAQRWLKDAWVQEEGIADADGLRQYIRKNFPDAEDAGRRSLLAEQETGYRDWHEWRVGTDRNRWRDGHWGTKWNACRFAPLENATDQQALIRFFTAWSPPRPIIIALSRHFPTLTFTLKYFEPHWPFYGIVRIGPGGLLKEKHYAE